MYLRRTWLIWRLNFLFSKILLKKKDMQGYAILLFVILFFSKTPIAKANSTKFLIIIELLKIIRWNLLILNLSIAKTISTEFHSVRVIKLLCNKCFHWRLTFTIFVVLLYGHFRMCLRRANFVTVRNS